MNTTTSHLFMQEENLHKQANYTKFQQFSNVYLSLNSREASHV